MEIGGFGKQARQFLTALKGGFEESKAKHPGQRYNVAFELHGYSQGLNESEILSFVSALESAVKQFAEDQPMKIVVNPQVISNAIETLETKTEETFKQFMALEESAQKKLVGVSKQLKG